MHPNSSKTNVAGIENVFESSRGSLLLKVLLKVQVEKLVSLNGVIFFFFIFSLPYRGEDQPCSHTSDLSLLQLYII